MGEQLKAIWADTTLTPEEKQKRSDELMNYYNGMADALRS